LVADQHPLAVELGGLGDLVRPLLVDQRQHLGGPGREDDLEQRRHVLEFLRQVSQMIRHPDRIAVKAPFVQVVADPGQLVCIRLEPPLALGGIRRLTGGVQNHGGPAPRSAPPGNWVTALVAAAGGGAGP